MIDSTFKNANILIVDDQQANIDVITGLLNIQGYLNVRTITDPRQVYNAFIEFKPDLILLDLAMPYMNGYQVMEQLKPLINETSFLPILVLTADITAEAKRRALSTGAKDFLTKPFDLIEVDLRIKNLLQTGYFHSQLENKNKVLEEKVQERTFQLEKAYKDLQKANEELQSLDEAKNGFLKIISHEIRTPLNGILGFTDVLKEELHDSEFSDALNYLDISAKRLFRFSKVALLITELRTKSRSVLKEDIHLAELIEKTKSTLSEKIQAKDIKVISDPEIKLNIFAETEMALICFESILDNAIHHSRQGGRITVNCFPEVGAVVCEFADEGEGFSEMALKNLFRMFTPGQEHVDQDMGLDLALVKHIMDAHQGSIEIQNTETKGATIRLKFIE